MNWEEEAVTRRRMLQAASAAGTVAIAGCSGSSEETSDPETDSETNGNKTNDGESEPEKCRIRRTSRVRSSSAIKPR